MPVCVDSTHSPRSGKLTSISSLEMISPRELSREIFDKLRCGGNHGHSLATQAGSTRSLVRTDDRWIGLPAAAVGTGATEREHRAVRREPGRSGGLRDSL